MKKKLKYLFIFLICFIFIDKVNANGILKCKYSGSYTNGYEITFKEKVELELYFESEKTIITKFKTTTTAVNYNDCKAKLRENLFYGHSEEEAERYYHESCSKREENHDPKPKLGFKISQSGGCPKNISFQYDANKLTLVSYETEKNYSLTDEVSSAATKASCGNITGIPDKIPELTSYIMRIVQVLVPVLLVIFGMLDLFKGITAQKEDEIKKGQSIFVKRLVIAVLIFFIVVFVKFLISIVAENSSATIIDCMDCFISNKCN